MRTGIIVLILMSLCISMKAECPPPQKPFPTPKDAAERIANAGFSVRKSFAATKDSTQPAAVSYADANEGGTFYNIDVAVRHNGIDCSWGNPETNGTKQFLFFPSVELHRSTVTSAEANKLSLVGNGEFYFIRNSLALDPFSVFKAALTRDAQKHQTNSAASVFLSSRTQTLNGGPGLPIRSSSGAFVARYYPFTGVEYFHNLPITTGLIRSGGIDVSFATIRLTTEWYPFNSTAGPGAFQILTDTAMRHRISGDSTVASTPWLFVGDAIYYLDAGQHFGIGYEFEKGRNPQNNFQYLRISSLNLKLKL